MACLAAVACGVPENAEQQDAAAPVWPDYADVTIPRNIAPLDFCLAEGSGAERIAVSVASEGGEEIMARSGKRLIKFPMRRWKRMLRDNAGHKLVLQVYTRDNGGWKSYRPFSFNVVDSDIDYGVTYRLIMAAYQSFGHQGIYERDLSSFRQRTLLDNRMTDDGCQNCHTPNRTDPSSYSLHIRGAHSATLLYHDGEMECLNTITDTTGGFFVYPSWHPGGDYIAYSVNKTRLSFYTHTDKKVEVYDQSSDLLVYKPSTHEVILGDAVRRKDKFETYPAFSADGRTIYFSVSDAGDLPAEMEGNQYSLCSIGFDAESGSFSEKVDTLVCGPELGMSFSTPRPSYDGKYILMAGTQFGTFPLWHKEADLYLYSLETGELRNATELNSDEPESFHNWSSDSQWVVFSSRRGDGLYTRLYIAHIGEDGRFGKPFLLPQRDPQKYYDGLMYSYNIPDFTSSPVPMDARQARGLVVSDKRSNAYIKK